MSSERISEHQAFLRPILDRYIAGLSEDEIAIASSMAEDFLRDDEKLYSGLVLTPVAAHQEHPDTVRYALYQHVLQQLNQPYSLLLSLNYPSSERDNSRIGEVVDAVQSVQHEYPQADIRFTIQEYETPTIGKIRRDLWNAAATIFHRKSDNALRDNDIILVNHDIDLEYMSPHFMRAIVEHHSRKSGMSRAIASIVAKGGIGLKESDEPIVNLPFCTPGKHAFDPRYPNASHVTFWSDCANKFSKMGFEAGMVIPMSFYAANGGFNAKAELAELQTFARSGGAIPGYVSMTKHRSAYSETNVRRYVERLHEYSPNNVWTDGSFDAHNEYRGNEHAMRDISLSRAQELVASRAIFDFENKFIPFVHEWIRVDTQNSLERYSYTVRRLHQRTLFATRVLEQFFDLPQVAADIVARSASMERALAIEYDLRSRRPNAGSV